jgi:hypothetical protein
MSRLYRTCGSLTVLWASMACYRDRFAISFHQMRKISVLLSSWTLYIEQCPDWTQEIGCFRRPVKCWGGIHSGSLERPNRNREHSVLSPEVGNRFNFRNVVFWQSKRRSNAEQKIYFVLCSWEVWGKSCWREKMVTAIIVNVINIVVIIGMNLNHKHSYVL